MKPWKMNRLSAWIAPVLTALRPARACRALCSLFTVLCSLSFGMAAEEAVMPNDYGPMFYGVELPEDGARLLLVIDTSKSMGRKDSARTDGGTRWDTLLDEVSGMADQMADIIARRRVCYTVSLLYEGGAEPPAGPPPPQTPALNAPPRRDNPHAYKKEMADRVAEADARLQGEL